MVANLKKYLEIEDSAVKVLKAMKRPAAAETNLERIRLGVLYVLNLLSEVLLSSVFQVKLKKIFRFCSTS